MANKLKVFSEFTLTDEFELEVPDTEGFKGPQDYVDFLTNRVLNYMRKKYGNDLHFNEEPLCDMEITLNDGEKINVVEMGDLDFNAPSCEFEEDWEEYKEKIHKCVSSEK